jgi:phosphatidylglycerol:prolipoprotein diacylglycerol transferase
MNLFGLFTGLGAVLALTWLRARHRQMGITENEFWVAAWLMALGGIVGAKCLFLVLGWQHYASGELRFWSDFGTGFVFFGGLVGAGITGILFATLKGLSFWRGADYFAVALPLGHAVGRLGCFLNGCCPGRPPHPVQLYELAGLLLISGACLLAVRKVEAGAQPRGSAFCLYGVLYGILRVLLDPFRADGRPERLLGLSHQQGIALALMFVAAGCWVILYRRHRVHSFNAQS